MKAGFSLDDMLAAPFPSLLRLSPDGERAAWVYNDRGCRNVWVAHTSGAVPARALTAYRGDEGIEIGQLCWNACGDALLYTRGACMDDGIPPDPDGLAGTLAAPAIWSVAASDGEPHRLAPGHSPAVSPRGDFLAYVHGGKIRGLHLAAPSADSLWVDEAGHCTSLAWSHDGTRLAFVNECGRRAAIGVLDIGSMTVHWLDPQAQHDLAPTWSPDGSALAFIRLADDPAPTYTGRRRGRPWSIMVADATGAEVRCAWRAAEGAGSVFAALAAGPQLLWTGRGHLVFPWEGNGWLHLYACDPGSDAATSAIELTPGPGEVFAMQEDSLGGGIVFVANRDQREGRRLWHCDQYGGSLSALSPGDAMTDLPAVANGVIAAIQADGITPPHPVVIGSGFDLGVRLPACFPAGLLQPPQSVAFASLDGLPIHAQLFLPAPLADGARHPAIIHCHGGPARQMLPAWHATEVYSKQYALNHYLARLGYLVLSVNYRGGTGYGLDFREPSGFGAGGASEYQDVKAAAHYLAGRGDIDPQRIGIYGMSYGGLLTALALARDSQLFAAGVDCAGVADWSPAFPDPGVPAAIRQTALASSPIDALGGWRSPVLLLHAGADRVVPPGQTDLLAEALRRQGKVEFKHILLAGESHDLLRHASSLTWFEATAAWFMRHLCTRVPDAGASLTELHAKVPI